MAGYPIGRAAPTQPLCPRAGMWGVRPWLALWPLALWALAIFIASCFVVGVPQFLAAVNAVLPDDESKARFAEFWRQYWWVVVKGFHAFEFAVIFWLANSSLRRFDRAKTPPPPANAPTAGTGPWRGSSRSATAPSTSGTSRSCPSAGP